jgi:hypothetical protein
MGALLEIEGPASPAPTIRRPSLWLVWMGDRGKRVGGDLEGLVCVPGMHPRETRHNLGLSSQVVC